jgi:hypothetical protein
MDINKVLLRKEELFKPIHQQILMTDDRNDLLLLATNMCKSSLRIFAEEYGIEGARGLVEHFLNNIS